MSLSLAKWRGVVSKWKDGHYHTTGKHTDDYVKIINYDYAEVYISGYRKDEFGWLVSVNDSDGRMRLAGVVELGVPDGQPGKLLNCRTPLVERFE